MGEEILSGRYLWGDFVFVLDFVVVGLITADIGIGHRFDCHFDWLRFPHRVESDFQARKLDWRTGEGIRRGVRRIVDGKGQSVRTHQTFVRTERGKNYCRKYWYDLFGRVWVRRFILLSRQQQQIVPCCSLHPINLIWCPSISLLFARFAVLFVGRSKLYHSGIRRFGNR